MNNEYIIYNYKINKTIANYDIDKTLKKKILKNNEFLMARRLLLLLVKGKFSAFFKIIKETRFQVKYFMIWFLPTENTDKHV